MDEALNTVVNEICQAHGREAGAMMDIVRQVQARMGRVSEEAIDLIAAQCRVPRVDVAGVVSFYAFLSTAPKGQVVIRVCNDVIDRMAGADRVGEAFCQALGIAMGQTTADGKITLEWTPCIGLSDQAPAALVNDVPITGLNTDKVWEIVRELKQHMDPSRLVRSLGDGQNANELVRAMVVNNIRHAGPVIFAPLTAGEALRKALAMSPVEVIRDVKTARLRGRGGAGFPTGMKWEFTRAAAGQKRCVLCNADEGEPGTFKDRVILTEQPDLLAEGMTIAGYAVGADEGIIYLRAEYAYLKRYLESVLARRRAAGLLGKDVCGKQGFHFDIRIQMGAGAYVCGEETSLISSCEGLRGDPKTRPPFPAQKGYRGQPTLVNNVETFCCAARILDKGPGWFAQLGSTGSAGTKLLSISGDCLRPGVYELEFGIKLSEVLRMAGAAGAAAVCVGGPSGQIVGTGDFDKAICFDHLPTGGSIMVFGPQRDVLDITEQFLDFFIEESCGYCTPCRVGNVLLKERLSRIRQGRGEAADLAYLERLGQTIRTASRCGLGQTSPNPVLSTLRKFPQAYAAKLVQPVDGRQPGFDIQAALKEPQRVQGRPSILYTH